MPMMVFDPVQGGGSQWLFRNPDVGLIGTLSECFGRVTGKRRTRAGLIEQRYPGVAKAIGNACVLLRVGGQGGAFE